MIKAKLTRLDSEAHLLHKRTKYEGYINSVPKIPYRFTLFGLRSELLNDSDFRPSAITYTDGYMAMVETSDVVETLKISDRAVTFKDISGRIYKLELLGEETFNGPRINIP